MWLPLIGSFETAVMRSFFRDDVNDTKTVIVSDICLKPEDAKILPTGVDASFVDVKQMAFHLKEIDESMVEVTAVYDIVTGIPRALIPERIITWSIRLAVSVVYTAMLRTCANFASSGYPERVDANSPFYSIATEPTRSDSSIELTDQKHVQGTQDTRTKWNTYGIHVPRALEHVARALERAMDQFMKHK
eukprot:GEMP01052941.1.p1 GENE.GEMP01052941.1~~GEMP01052941.1.p1  ORF type:complete len:190 (+),score=37.12 GEMP01052941.1:433-1002(+)